MNSPFKNKTLWSSLTLPCFGRPVTTILWRWALTHHGGHVNLKVFGDVLYVWLGETHSTWGQNEPSHYRLYI